MKSSTIKIYHLNGHGHENNEVTVPENEYTKIEVVAASQVAAKFKKLDVNRNTITTIQRVTKLTGIHSVNAEDSDYEDIPRWVAHLPSLKSLKFNDNNIEELPDWLFTSCHNLKVLNITNCQLKKLPDDLFEYKLKKVFVSDNSGE